MASAPLTTRTWSSVRGDVKSTAGQHSGDAPTCISSCVPVRPKPMNLFAEITVAPSGRPRREGEVLDSGSFAMANLHSGRGLLSAGISAQ